MPDSSSSQRSRGARPSVWRYVHLWAGLVLGVPLIVVSVSGALAVYGQGIDRWWHGSRHLTAADGGAAPAAVYDGLAERLQLDVGADATVSYVGMPAYTGSVIEVWASRRHPAGDGRQSFTAYYDPANGSLLGSTLDSRLSAATAVVAALHTELLAGDIGYLVVGFTGIAGLVFVVTGLVLWLPRTRAALPFWRIRWRGAAASRDRDLHHVGSLLAGPVVLLTALSGVWLVFPSTLDVPAELLSPAAPAAPAEAVAERPPQRLSELLAAAERSVPGAAVSWLPALPVRAGEPLELTLTYPGNPDPYQGGVRVRLDPGDGRILAVDDARGQGIGRWLQRNRFGLHTGSWAGVGGEAIYALLSLLPLLLGWTGWTIWRRRVNAGRPRRRD